MMAYILKYMEQHWVNIYIKIYLYTTINGNQFIH